MALDDAGVHAIARRGERDEHDTAPLVRQRIGAVGEAFDREVEDLVDGRRGHLATVDRRRGAGKRAREMRVKWDTRRASMAAKRRLDGGLRLRRGRRTDLDR